MIHKGPAPLPILAGGAYRFYKFFSCHFYSLRTYIRQKKYIIKNFTKEITL